MHGPQAKKPDTHHRFQVSSDSAAPFSLARAAPAATAAPLAAAEAPGAAEGSDPALGGPGAPRRAVRAACSSASRLLSACLSACQRALSLIYAPYDHFTRQGCVVKCNGVGAQARSPHAAKPAYARCNEALGCMGPGVGSEVMARSWTPGSPL